MIFFKIVCINYVKFGQTIIYPSVDVSTVVVGLHPRFRALRGNGFLALRLNRRTEVQI